MKLKVQAIDRFILIGSSTLVYQPKEDNFLVSLKTEFQLSHWNKKEFFCSLKNFSFLVQLLIVTVSVPEFAHDFDSLSEMFLAKMSEADTKSIETNRQRSWILHRRMVAP